MSGERTTEEWAKRIAELMPEAEFREFVGFVDGCDDIEFWSALCEIDRKKHPKAYEDDPDFYPCWDETAIVDIPIEEQESSA